MEIGVVWPQTECTWNAETIRRYAIAVEELGFSHILVYDHVLGANTRSRPDWNGPFKLESPFLEPLVLIGYLAGATRKLSFSTGVLILSQRQAVLVAKQSASLDLMCDGRLRLGVGTGWNEVEYRALGMSYQERGSRIEEQVQVMRKLWSNEAVTFNGRYHVVDDAGINPLPKQRPIPIWFGGGSDRPAVATDQPSRDTVLRRIASLGDGWIPQWQPDARGRELLTRFRSYVREAGRNPATIGLQGRLWLAAAETAIWAERVASWRDVGATHLALNTMGDGLRDIDQHIERLEQFRRTVG